MAKRLLVLLGFLCFTLLLAIPGMGGGFLRPSYRARSYVRQYHRKPCLKTAVGKPKVRIREVRKKTHPITEYRRPCYTHKLHKAPMKKKEQQTVKPVVKKQPSPIAPVVKKPPLKAKPCPQIKRIPSHKGTAVSPKGGNVPWWGWLLIGLFVLTVGIIAIVKLVRARRRP